MIIKLTVKMKTLFLIILIIPSVFVSGAIMTISTTSKNEGSRDDIWILDLQTNGFNNPQWYYKNLNNEDRKKIRLALDYMIDRDHIINDIEQGMGVKTLSFISPITKYFLDNGTKPRSYDKDKAKFLLSEVFGYTFDSKIDDPNTPYNETFPYFNITMLLPNNNVYRIQWGTDIVNEWRSIGIVVTLIETALTNIEEILYTDDFWIYGKDFNHGGLDVTIIGSQLYGFDFKSPAMQMSQYRNQIPYFDNITELMNLYNTALYDQNVTSRDKAIQNYQQWIYDNVPTSFILWTTVLNMRNKAIKGINDFTRTNYENWTYPGHVNVTILAKSKEQFEWLNPLFYPLSWLACPDGQIAINALYRGLFYTTTDNNLLPRNPVTYPYFADWFNKSADGLTWFVNMKQGLKWHDGVELNTSDVKFTFDLEKFNDISEAFQGEIYLSQLLEAYQSWNIGNISVNIENSTLVKFTLEQPYNFFKEDVLTMPIIPKHILENISNKDLLSDSSNTGINGTVIGNGPYIFVNKIINPVTVTLQKWSDWDASYNSLIANNKMDQIVPGSSVPTLEYLNLIEIGDEVQALKALKNGTADITLQYLVSFYFLNLLDQVTDPIMVVNEIRSAVQEIYYNPSSSIWGLVPKEPCKLYNTSCVLSPTPTITTSTTSLTTTTSTITTTSASKVFVDSISIFLAFSVLAIVLVYSRKKH